MHFVNLRTGKHEKITLPEGFSGASSRRYNFSMTEAANIHVNVDEGSMLVPPTDKQGRVNSDVIQNVSLAFTVSLLYLVCLHLFYSSTKM